MQKDKKETYHYPVLLSIARDALHDQGLSGSAIAIVFSALSIEAYINELPNLLLVHLAKFSRVQKLSEIIKYADEEKASIQLKLILTSFILSGRIPNLGSQPYQDIALLFKLRNLIVHLKPVESFLVEDDNYKNVPKLVKSFCARGVIPKPTRKSNYISWSDQLLVPSVGKWSTDTVLKFGKYLITLPQNEDLKTLLTGLYLYMKE